MASTRGVASPEQSPRSPWREYYVLRKRARLSVLAMIFVLAFVTGPLLQVLTDRLSNRLPPWVLIVIFFGVDGAVIILLAIPAVKWANWRCPRCGKAFAQPTPAPGGNVFAVLLRFFVPSRCANCGLSCGADLPTAPSPAG